MERAGILSDGFEGAAEGTEGPAVDGVGVGYCVNFRARGVHGVVDHIRLRRMC